MDRKVRKSSTIDLMKIDPLDAFEFTYIYQRDGIYRGSILEYFLPKSKPSTYIDC